MKRAGVAPTAVTYTSLMHACVKHGSAENVEYAFQARLFLTTILAHTSMCSAKLMLANPWQSLLASPFALGQWRRHSAVSSKNCE